jgi:hypothetical protein
MGIRTEEVWLLMEQLGGRTNRHKSVMGVYTDKAVADEDLRRLRGPTMTDLYSLERWDVDHEPVASEED